MSFEIWGTSRTWNGIEDIWKELINRLEALRSNRGRSAKLISYWNNNLTDKERHRFIQIIITLKGFKYSQSISFKNYQVTAEDIELLLEGYERIRNNLMVEVSDILID